jgi:O-succinylbenzoate synthase
MRLSNNYYGNVFINCPFDTEYEEFLRAITFTVTKCGLVLRCAKEIDESSSVRIENIIKLITDCKYSIHDLSRVSLDKTSDLPRFNMPLELGICIGAMKFGIKKHKEKEYLIIESKQFDSKKFISDLSGQDVKNHNNNPEEAIKCVRNWLAHKVEFPIPSASLIIAEYNEFLTQLPELGKENNWIENELTFNEHTSLVYNWLKMK